VLELNIGQASYHCSMIPTELLQAKFEAALSYEDYVRTGTPEQQRRWNAIYQAAGLSDPQRRLVEAMTRSMRLLVVSGIWCGDCVEQCPLLARIAEANPNRVFLRLLERDQHQDLSQRLRINQGDRVPMALLLAEDCAFCAAFGDRTLARYRALAAQRLGPACPIGLAVPPQEQLVATLQDWLNEIERVQLMLRLSPRLRQKHGD
jgi:thiol-disulfide isomerase/thioredoxin